MLQDTHLSKNNQNKKPQKENGHSGAATVTEG